MIIHLTHRDTYTSTVEIVWSHGLRKIIRNQKVISATSLSQLKNQLVSTMTETILKNKKELKLLGTKSDSPLSSEGHITSLCKKTSQKLHALARIVNYVEFPRRMILIKASATSQFSYCPLIWMLHNKTLNNHNYIYPRKSTETDI